MQAISHNSSSMQPSAATPRLDAQSRAGIQVSGNKISRSSDGWHEVQYASSFNAVSEGGQSATLEPGVYNVINHSTGERFENITIGHDNGGASQMRSSLDELRDSPSTADRLSGSNDTTDTNNNTNSGSSVGTESSHRQIREM